MEHSSDSAPLVSYETEITHDHVHFLSGSSSASTAHSDRDMVAVSLLKNGSHALFYDTTAKPKAPFVGGGGQPTELPQMEISFRGLSTSVNLPVVKAASSQPFELPTLVNVVKQSL